MLSTGELSYEELAAIVDWYVDMGVDLAVDGAPHDRFIEEKQRLERATAPRPAAVAAVAATALQRPAAGPRLVPALPAAVIAPDQAIESAKEIAARAQTLEALQAALEAFDGCALKRGAQRTVFADGNPQARLMLVGEAPGADEDRQGLPFVGRAGQLLDRMLASISLDRSNVYIANVAPWRPPGNRTPTPQEIAICLPFVKRQIELCNPQVVVCLGATAMQALLGVTEGIMKTRGRAFDYPLGNGHKIKALATLHPSYLLRSPAAKRLAWRDLQAIAKLLAETQ